MARSSYHEDRTERFTVGVLRFVKTSIDKQKRREQDRDIRDALRSKSASKFLREIK